MFVICNTQEFHALEAFYISQNWQRQLINIYLNYKG